MSAPTHDITLRFADGITKQLRVSDGEVILDAAIEAGIPVLHQCRSGSCSSCICQLAEGDAVTSPGASSTLMASEYSAGHRLLCVTQARTDCTFDLAYASTLGSAPVVDANAFINRIERIAANVIKLTLELADGDWLTFLPGQFLQVVVPGTGVVRSYSPVSTAADLPIIELLVRLIPGGAMSTYLSQQARPDDVLTLRGPHGAFFLREKVRAPHIFVAGGTGLAPVLSMIDHLRRSCSRRPKMLLSFGCTTADDLFYLDELEARQSWLPSFEARICVREGATVGLHTGNPVSVLGAEDIVDPDTVAYLCGPQPMIEAATKHLLALGMAPQHIFAEQFVAS